MLDLLFVTDPPARLDPRCDSSIALMQSACRRGHHVDHALPSDLTLRDADCYVHGRAVAGYHAVFLRPDPPFDAEYLTTTLILERARDRCLIVNDPRGVRNANEKLYTLNFPEFIPPRESRARSPSCAISSQSSAER
jgi:glutathione synthase